ncbi:hypothetical protein, partial [Cellulomonas iranensis]|uniref:hypothetical protein n=1 Tax=Cellulomonas iranensis TaxID=76862 RepID=UPI0015C5F12A
GHLRTLATVKSSSVGADASERIRIYCLEAFAREGKIPFSPTPLPGWELRPTVSPRLPDLIADHLRTEAEKWSDVARPDTLVRGLAMWGVMSEALPRLGELEAIRLDDLAFAGRCLAVTITRQPQGGLRGKTPQPET